MMLNLRRDDFLLQALQNSFAFRDRQADGSGRDPVRALNRGNLVFNLFTVNHFSDQLHCPFRPSSLPHPQLCMLSLQMARFVANRCHTPGLPVQRRLEE